jgi:uncharacterized protein (DUF433 family)
MQMPPPTTPTRTQWVYLERDPKSSYKQLSIKGRRIRARTLYAAFVNEEEPRTVEQIAADWNVPVPAVEEAIAYCQSNPPEIDEDYRREEAIAEASGMNDPAYRLHPKPKPLSDEDRKRIAREFPRA